MNIYKDIVYKFIRQLIDESVTYIDTNDLFTVSSDEKLLVLTDLYNTYSNWSSLYSKDELFELKHYSVPRKVIDFYKHFSPKNSISLYGDVNLLSLKVTLARFAGQ